MVHIFKTIQTWQYILILLSAFVILPAWIPALFIGLYTFINFLPYSKKKLLIIKCAVIILSALFFLLLFKFFPFDFQEKRNIAIAVWAAITNIVLHFLGKNRTTEWFVYVFFIGVLSNFNIQYTLTLYTLFFFYMVKNHINNWKVTSFIFIFFGFINFGFIQFMESKDLNLTKITMFLIDPKTSMDTSFNGYSSNPEGIITLNKKSSYLAINRFDTFNKEKQIWEKSSSEFFDFSDKRKKEKLILNYDCPCSDLFKKSIEPAIQPGMSGVYMYKINNKKEDFTFDALPLKQQQNKNINVKNVIKNLEQKLIQERFVYDKNVTKMVSLYQNDDFFKTYKIGLCRHFASYAAHYLREHGVNANVVIGFASSNGLDSHKFYFKDAHAWVEYFDIQDNQWKRFDGTSLVPQNKESSWVLLAKIMHNEYSYLYILACLILFLWALSFYIRCRFIQLNINPWLLYKENKISLKDYEYWESIYNKKYWRIFWFIYCMKRKKSP